MPRVIILTGAGASYGCGDTKPYNPPLGSQLYSRLEQFAPEIMSQLSPIVDRHDAEDFESVMHRIWTSNKVNPVVLNALIATYFAQFAPSTGNTYIEMFKIMKSKDVQLTYSTLNYDCIAELAASQVGYKINYSSKESDDKLSVLKLHGSCNFLLGGVTGPLGAVGVPAMDQVVDGPIEAVQPHLVGTLVRNRPFGPCMSFYMKNKPTPVGKATVTEIQEAWKSKILDSHSVIIIGLSVNLEDSHIWGAFSRTNAKVGFVGSNQALGRLSSVVKGSVTHLAEDFKSSIEKISTFID